MHCQSVRRQVMTATLLAGIAMAMSASSASAQYLSVGGFGYGYAGPPAVGWGGPMGFMGPAYPPPFGFAARHMARRQAMMQRFAERHAYRYPAPPLAPVPPVAPLRDAPYLEGPAAIAPEEFTRSPDFSLPLPPSESGAFAASAARLGRALSQRENGDVWIEYLQADRLVAMADHGQVPSGSELRELTTRYQGVLANPDLAWLVRTDGFEDTLAGLSALTGTFSPGVPQSPARSGGPLPDARSTGRSGVPTMAPDLHDAQGNTPQEKATGRRDRRGKPSGTGASRIEVLPEPIPEPDSGTTSL